MAIPYDKLIELEAPAAPFTYTDRETMLYALGIGLGGDPMDRRELPFVYENGLRTVPTMATVVAWDHRVLANTGINRLLVVHGEQRITLHRPLPTAATVLAGGRIREVVDKGEGRGLLLYVEQTIRDKDTGEPLCTNLSTVFARGDGGVGGPAKGGPAPHALPQRAPDAASDLATRPDQALLYRLSGDRNPLHSDPDVARTAGFDRPILHGLCTYGIACRAILGTMLDYDAAAVTGFEARFSAPVFPGETIRTEMWRDGSEISFRCLVPGRDSVVLDNGRATLAA